MSTPSDPGARRSEPGVELGKSASGPPTPPAVTPPPPAAAAPFDPYRFGKPERPVPPEYAPPGYVPDPADYPTGRPATPPYPPAGPRTSQASTPYPGPPPGPSEPHAPYGAPTPPPYHGYVQPRTGNGKAIAALVLGLASIPLCFVSILDAALIVPAVILGLIALGESRSGRTGGRGLAIAGVACAVVGAVLAALVTVWYVHAANRCGGLDQGSSAEFKQCVQQHL